jgi:hypothetical protein
MRFTMTLAAFQAHSPCSLDRFFMRSGGADSWVLPDGWQESTTEQFAREWPLSLLWYSAKGLIPVTYAEAKAALVKAHGADTTKVIRAAFAAGASPRCVK